MTIVDPHREYFKEEHVTNTLEPNISFKFTHTKTRPISERPMPHHAHP